MTTLDMLWFEEDKGQVHCVTTQDPYLIAVVNEADRYRAEAEGSYLPAKALLHPQWCKDFAALRRALAKQPIRRRRPHPRRLEVHAGDWARYLIGRGCRDPLNLPAALAEALLASVRDLEARKAAGRKKRQ
jgi:hypothetical protein